MISENWLPGVRRAIRNFVVLPEEEPIDIILLAAFLLNHAPSREVNVWLNIITPQGEAKTELVNLIIDYPTSWKLPDRLSQGYFFSGRTLERSAMRRIEQSGARVLFMSDLATLTEGVPYQYQGDVYTQLLSIHDGYFKTETGLNSVPLEYGPKAPNDRIGWIGAGTESFYEFFNRKHRLGTRFLLYFMDPSRHRHWTDTEDLETVHRRQPNQAENRRVARDTVHAFIDSARRELDDFEFVRIAPAADVRVAAASTLVSRVMGAGAVQDRGTRRSLRIREMCRMFAFMSGRAQVNEGDVDLGVRITFSQLTPAVNRVLAFALSPERLAGPWMQNLIGSELGMTRRVYEPILQMLADLEILTRAAAKRGESGYKFQVSEHTVGLLKKFDAEGKIFATQRPGPTPVAIAEEEW